MGTVDTTRFYGSNWVLNPHMAFWPYAVVSPAQNEPLLGLLPLGVSIKLNVRKAAYFLAVAVLLWQGVEHVEQFQNFQQETKMSCFGHDNRYHTQSLHTPFLVYETHNEMVARGTAIFLGTSGTQITQCWGGGRLLFLLQ